jgi:hypothetical protein
MRPVTIASRIWSAIDDDARATETGANSPGCGSRAIDGV